MTGITRDDKIEWSDFERRWPIPQRRGHGQPGQNEEDEICFCMFNGVSAAEFVVHACVWQARL